MKHQTQIQHAGGFRIVDGSPNFRLMKRGAIQPWRSVIKKFLLNKKVRNKDLRIEHMLFAAELEWTAYVVPGYPAWASQTPLEKQQALFAWILRQTNGRRKYVIDILASGIAGHLYNTLKPQPRHDSYAHAVSVARPIWFLLRPEFRTFEHDNGHGLVTSKTVWINKRIRLRSRYCCQRIETEIQKHAGWLIREYYARLIVELQKKGLI